MSGANQANQGRTVRLGFFPYLWGKGEGANHLEKKANCVKKGIEEVRIRVYSTTIGFSFAPSPQNWSFLHRYREYFGANRLIGSPQVRPSAPQNRKGT